MIVVDGYNVIYKWKSLAKFVYNMDLARVRLINILTNYGGYIGEEIVLVFDSSSRDTAGLSDNQPQNIKVIYAPSREGADIFIEKMVSSYSERKDITIISGDNMVRTAGIRCGANTMSPERFEEEVEKICNFGLRIADCGF